MNNPYVSKTEAALIALALIAIIVVAVAQHG